MFCPNCGTEIKAAARFCPECGSALPQPAAVPVPEEAAPVIEEEKKPEPKKDVPLMANPFLMIAPTNVLFSSISLPPIPLPS